MILDTSYIWPHAARRGPSFEGRNKWHYSNPSILNNLRDEYAIETESSVCEC
jgi:hypothetical protein